MRRFLIAVASLLSGCAADNGATSTAGRPTEPTATLQLVTLTSRATSYVTMIDDKPVPASQSSVQLHQGTHVIKVAWRSYPLQSIYDAPVYFFAAAGKTYVVRGWWPVVFDKQTNQPAPQRPAPKDAPRYQ